MKKAINLVLLICGIICSIFLLLEAIPSFPNLTTGADTLLKVLIILEAILLLALPILLYFPKLRIYTFILAIILIVMLIVKWQYTFSIIYIIYALLIIAFNTYSIVRNNKF